MFRKISIPVIAGGVVAGIAADLLTVDFLAGVIAAGLGVFLLGLAEYFAL